MPRNLSEGNKKDGTGCRLTKLVTLHRRARDRRREDVLHSPLRYSVAGAALYQFALNVVAEIISFDSEEALLRVGFCKVGCSLHSGHDSDSCVVGNTENSRNLLRRIQIVGFDLDATDTLFPLLFFFTG